MDFASIQPLELPQPPAIVEQLPMWGQQLVSALVRGSEAQLEASRQVLQKLEDSYITADAALFATVSAHTTTLATHDTAIATLETTVSSHTTSIATLQSDLDTAEAAIVTNTAAINTNATAITTLDGAVATLTTTVSSHTTSISTINGQITTLSASVTTNASAITSIEGHLLASYALVVDGNGRIASMYLLSNGSTADIIFTGDSFQFYDGITDRPLFTAGGGVFKVNGDVAIGGSITIGGARLAIALEPFEIQAVDGASIQWAGGQSIGTAPKYTIETSALDVLASGERYDVRLTSVTATGATVYAKITTPSGTALRTETTDAAGGGGDPDRVMHKPNSADSYNDIYEFTVSGTIDVVSTLDGSLYVHNGQCDVEIFFNDGGGWDSAGIFSILAYEVLGYITGSDETGSHAWEKTFVVNWSAAVGQHGGTEFGVSHSSGGSVTDLDKVEYTSTTASGTRTASPAGEKVKIIVFPRNVVS